MREQIKAIIEDTLAIDFSYDDENGNLFTDLGFDSLDQVEIVIECEREFNIDISNEAAEHWQTINDIVKTCENCINEKK